MLRCETDLRRRIVAPKSESPVAVSDGDVVELVGRTYRRFIRNFLDERFIRVGGKS